MGKKKTEEEPPGKLNKSRSCTDVICLLLFLVFLGGWVGIAVWGLNNGKPDHLFYPTNSRGEICGRGEQADKENLMFHDLTKCVSVSAVLGCNTPQVCVEDCPHETTSLFAFAWALKTLNLPVPEGFGGFLIEDQKRFCTSDLEEEVWTNAVDNISLEPNEAGETFLDLISQKICPAYTLSSITLAGRCVPDFGIISGKTNDSVMTDNGGNYNIENEDGDINAGSVLDAIEKVIEILNLRGYAEKIWADFNESMWWILAGGGLAVVVAFIWIFLMRFLAGVMVWLSLFLTIGLLSTSTAYSWLRYDSLATEPGSDGSVLDVNPLTQSLDTYLALRQTWLIFLIMSSVILALVLIIVIFLRTRIRIAIQLINEASRAVGSVMSSLFYPLFSFLLELLVVAWFLLVAVYLASTTQQVFTLHPQEEGGCGELEAGSVCQITEFIDTETCVCQFVRVEPDQIGFYLQIVNIFGLFWGLCFVSALGEMVLAGAFSAWYWVRDKKDISGLPLVGSIVRTFRYHTGTLAFGSLVIAIIKMIRLALQYVQDKLEEKGADNPVVKVLICCCKCCFYCLEKFVKFINRNAYIITAAYGFNFCSSAKEAFSLILRNVARVAVLDKVTDFLLFLGKMVITVTVMLSSYAVFSGTLGDTVPFEVKTPELNYYFVPIIIITIFAYFVSACFFSVFAMAVDTLFLCFLLDIEKNDGSVEKPYFMSKKLMEILDLKNKKSKAS